MKPSVMQYLEKKLGSERFRLKRIIPNQNYDELELGPECSKAFGFPDNSMIVDPDSAILNLNSIGGAKRSDKSTELRPSNSQAGMTAENTSNKTPKS